MFNYQRWGVREDKRIFEAFIAIGTLILLWPVPFVAAVDDTRPVALSGSVSAMDGRVPRNMVVFLRHGPEYAYEYTSTPVDASGQFGFHKLKPGLVVIATFAKGMAVTGQSRLMLQPGQKVTNVRLELSKADSVSVAILDSDSKPVAGAKLSQLMWRIKDSPPVWLTEPFLRRVDAKLPVSDARGVLSIPWIPPNAEFSIRVSHPDFAISETPISTVSKERLSLVLHRGKPVTIRVVNAAAGIPATDAIVSVNDAALSPFEQSERRVNNKGEYRMRIAKGKRVIVQVSHPKLASARAIFFWKNEPTELEVKLYRGALLKGRVVDSKGQPAENVRIAFSIASKTSAFSAGTVTDNAGRYRIEAREGQGLVTPKSGRGYVYDGKQIPIRLHAGDVTTLPDMIVSQIPPIRGIAVNPNGTPLPFALISDQSLPFGGQLTQADSEGRFQLPLVNIPRLATLVIARHPTQPMSGGLVIPFDKVREGKEFRIPVQLESTLQGKVEIVEEEGSPAVGVRVTAEMLIDMGKRKYLLPIATTVTDKGGKFQFKGLSRHTRYHVRTSSRGTRDIPDDLIELQQHVVEMSKPLRVKSSNVEADRATTSQPPPPLVCEGWINSSPLRLSELTGKVVLIDFWGTWCRPCVAELPKLQLAHQLYADKGLVIIGLHDNSASEAYVRNFIKQQEITFPIALDNSKGQTVGRYNITRWPTKVLIDRHGNRVDFRSDDDLFTVLRTLVLYETN